MAMENEPLLGSIESGRPTRRAVAWVLGAVFEQDFLECSHGFCPTQPAHGASSYAGWHADARGAVRHEGSQQLGLTLAVPGRGPNPKDSTRQRNSCSAYPSGL